jgi:uncharacterized protein YjiS (DUF1127 family)
MLTCKSPRKVMRVAHHLASQCLPQYTCKFSRKDFTLAQLFACLVVKEHQRCSYRGVEALLRDSEHWLADIGLSRCPDHNTLCRAAAVLLSKGRADRLLDPVAHGPAGSRILGLATDPLAIDSTTYDSHHVSRHYERRCRQTRQRMRAKEKAKTGRKSTRADTVKGLPKLGIGVATRCHLILSAWTGTGGGSDHPHFEPVLFDAWRRVPHRSFDAVLDAGYDGEEYHQIARRDMGIRSIIPPAIGRAPAQGPNCSDRRALAAAHETAAGDQGLAPPLRVQPPLPVRDGQQHDEAEPGLGISRQDRRLAPARHAAQGPHAQRDDPEEEGRDRADLSRFRVPAFAAWTNERRRVRGG